MSKLTKGGTANLEAKVNNKKSQQALLEFFEKAKSSSDQRTLPEFDPAQLPIVEFCGGDVELPKADIERHR